MKVLAWLMLLACGPVAAQAWRCQQDGVDMLVGGSTQRCIAPGTTSTRVAAIGTTVAGHGPGAGAWSVPSSEQAARDRDRRQVLETELQTELQASADTRRDTAARQRALENVAALKRELTRLGR